MLVLAFVFLGFATLDTFSGHVVVWLHPNRASWASPWGLVWMKPLGTHRHDANCFVHTFPLFCSVRWWAYHACLYHPLAFFASLHTCLHVHVWVLLASVLSMLQHNEVMNIRSKPIVVPHEHPILCVFPACLHSLVVGYLSFFCHVLCLPYLSCLFALRPCAFIYAFSFHCLSTSFFISTFACAYMERGRMELGHDLLGASQKGMDASSWSSQAIAVSRFRSLAFSLWLCTL